ncbi:MAG: hypothetical protein ACKOC8_09225 [Pirellulales bacterium]
MSRVAPPIRRIAWCCLAVQGLVASGLPLPLAVTSGAGGRVNPVAAARLAGKDRSTPFPCMDKPCGCATAEQCFTSCCCNTPAETLSWARAHRVDAAVVQALTKRVAAAAAPAATHAGSCCSAASVAPSCCSVARRPADPPADDAACGVCRSLAGEPGPAAAESPLGEEPAGKVVTLRAMLACGGLVSAWMSCGVSVPPPSAPPIPAPIPVATAALVDEAPTMRPSPPDAPPPRQA